MNVFQRTPPTKAIREMFASWVLDGKTRATNSIPAGPSGSLDKIQAAFVVGPQSGHLHQHQFGAYDLFENAGTAKDKRWMILSEAEYSLPCYHWQLEALAFFDHLLY